MNLEEIQENWAIDSRIDRDDIATECIRVPSLHSKYLQELSVYRLKKQKMKTDFDVLRNLRCRYYQGKLSHAELTDNNWPQWQEAKPLKTEMHDILNGDSIMILAANKLAYVDNIIYCLESILKSIASRSFDLKNFVAYSTLMAGG